MTPTTLPRRPWVADFWRIGVVLLLALATRLWVLRHTEVLSRDSIGFIRYALQLEEPPEGMSRSDVLRANAHPPGYPVAILAISWPVRSCMGETSCDSMVRSAQLASIIASLLLIFPMYFTGRLLFDRQIGFLATLLFQVIPVTTQVTSDGLSDGVFLLMIGMALWFGVLGLRRGSPIWFAGAGLFAGGAYLVRPEGLIVGLALGLVCLGLMLRGVWNWKPTLVRGSALIAGALFAMTPYVATIGKLTNKPTGDGILKGEAHPSWERQQSLAPPSGVNVPLAEWWNQEQGIYSSRAVWAVKALTLELIKASFYVLPIFAILGLFWMRSRIRENAGVALLVVLGGIHLLLLWLVASRAGYVAERHTLLVVMCGSYFTASALSRIGEKLATIPSLARRAVASNWALIITFLLVIAAIPAGMKILHANRAGHHAAGMWLAQHRQPKEHILDPFAWSEFYAGHIRGPSKTPPFESGEVHAVYVVIEGMASNPHPRLHLMPEALSVARVGELVYHWPVNVPAEKAKVFIYRWDVKAMHERHVRPVAPATPGEIADRR